MVVERKGAVFGVFVLLMLVGFIAANKLWFYPNYTVQIQSPVLYTPPADVPKAVVIKPFEGTLKKIIQQDDSAEKDTAQAGKARNPFLWKGELQPKGPEAPVKIGKQVQPVEIPRLGMIIIGEGKTVMLDDTLVHPGETYGGHVIENIGPDHVILSGDYGVLKISMLEKSFGAPKVDILEETNPNLLIKPVLSEKKQR